MTRAPIATASHRTRVPVLLAATLAAACRPSHRPGADRRGRPAPRAPRLAHRPRRAHGLENVAGPPAPPLVEFENALPHSADALAAFPARRSDRAARRGSTCRPHGALRRAESRGVTTRSSERRHPLPGRAGTDAPLVGPAARALVCSSSPRLRRSEVRWDLHAARREPCPAPPRASWICRFRRFRATRCTRHRRAAPGPSRRAVRVVAARRPRIGHRRPARRQPLGGSLGLARPLCRARCCSSAARPHRLLAGRTRGSRTRARPVDRLRRRHGAPRSARRRAPRAAARCSTATRPSSSRSSAHGRRAAAFSRPGRRACGLGVRLAVRCAAHAADRPAASRAAVPRSAWNTATKRPLRVRARRDARASVPRRPLAAGLRANSDRVRAARAGVRRSGADRPRGVVHGDQRLLLTPHWR